MSTFTSSHQWRGSYGSIAKGSLKAEQDVLRTKVGYIHCALVLDFAVLHACLEGFQGFSNMERHLISEREFE